LTNPHGGDGGGSIRIPASCCGLFGLKPTRGRTPAGPDSSEHWSGYAIEHVISRSVRDSAAALDATEGPEPSAPYHAPPMEGSFLDEIGREPGQLRIGFHWEPAMLGKVHADCVAAVKDAAKLLVELGHDVEQVDPEADAEDLTSAYFTVIAANTAAEIREGERSMRRRARPKHFETETWLAAQMGRVFTGEKVVVAQRKLQTETRRLVDRLGKYDVILTPTLAQPPRKIGSLGAPAAEAMLQDVIKASRLRLPLRLEAVLARTLKNVFAFIPFTPVANFTGQPAMSVPLYWNGAGLPIGTMYTARFGDEATLFRLASQLECARPWWDNRPPFHASGQ
jgi:amidase